MRLGRISRNEGQEVVLFILAQGSRRPQSSSEVQLCWALEALQAVCRTWYTTQQGWEGQIPRGGMRAIVCHFPGKHQGFLLPDRHGTV